MVKGKILNLMEQEVVLCSSSTVTREMKPIDINVISSGALWVL